MKHLINLKYTNPKNNPMFLGEGLGIQRYDQFKYDYLYRLYQQQLGQFWRPEEVSLVKDRVDYKKLDKEQQFVFTKNLAYQTILDTDQARGLRLLAEYTSIPELELFINVWLFFEQIHCLPSDDEILTKDGWKKLSELTYDDYVANWYPDGRVEFTKPINIERQHYKGLMYKFNQTGYELVCTPNHRVAGFRKWYDNKFIVDTAKNISLSGLVIPTSTNNKEGEKQELTAIERIAVSFQADGTIVNHYKYKEQKKTYRGYCYRFNFSKKRKAERLLSLIEEAGLDYTYKEKENDNYSNGKQYVIYLWSDMKFDKEFDWVDLEKISSKWASEFIEELQYWDGCLSSAKAVRYINTNKKAIDKVMAIACLGGYRVGVDDKGKERNDLLREKYIREGRDISKFKNSKKKSYSLHLYKKEYATGRDMKKESFLYDGEITGVKVPSSFIIVRHNGKYISITGNSESYTHIIRNVLPDTDKFWEENLQDKELLKRVKSTTEEYDKLLNIKTTNEQTLKESLFDLVVAINILESIRFFVSFACSFSFMEQTPAVMEGNGKVIQLIKNDEDNHCIATQYILKKWREREDEGFVEIWKAKEDKVYEMYYNAVQEEIEWAKYLFKDSPQLLGLNDKILERYMKWLTDKRLRQIGLKPLFNEDKENPMTWIEKYSNRQQINVAPQESELESYNIGQYENDLDVSKDKFKDFILDK